MGLAISKQIIEKMNGNIGVESTEGKESTFFIRLTLPSGQQPKAEKDEIFQLQGLPIIVRTANAMSHIHEKWAFIKLL